ncbi:hypothetical protein FKM82_019218 [Ascaphus truei]
MSDEEYSFLNVKRYSRMNLLTMKHSTPLTSILKSTLPTLEESGEESNFELHGAPMMDNQRLASKQAIGVTIQSSMVQKKCTSFSSKLSPILASEEETSLYVKTKENRCDARSEETSIMGNFHNKFTSQTSNLQRKNIDKKQKREKKLIKLRVKEKVERWVIQQLKNIEEATKHNLLIEYV